MFPTKVVEVDPRKPDEGIVREALEVLSRGGIVAYPTETFYGLAVDARDPDACEKVFQRKGRPQEKALPCIVSSLAQVEALGVIMTPALRLVAARFWPGPLSVVLETRPALAAASEDGSVALRVSGLPLARRLAEALGGPITATSANRSGEPPPSTATAVLAQLGKGLDLVLDGGASQGGAPSTIIDLRGGQPRRIREGVVPFEDVLRALETLT